MLLNKAKLEEENRNPKNAKVLIFLGKSLLFLEENLREFCFVQKRKKMLVSKKHKD